MPESRPSILCVDHDRDVAEVVLAILEDEGYAVSCLYDLTDDGLLRTIGRLEPDAVLLDGFTAKSYGEGWDLAAGIRNRSRPVSVVMFTPHMGDVAEAEEATSERARQANFAAILSKPFGLDELVEAVARG